MFKTFIKKYNFKKALILALAIAVLLLILFFIFRNAVLHSVMESKISKFQNSKKVSVNVGDSYFSGFTGVTIENIVLIPEKCDTFLTCSKLYVHIKILPLLFGNVSFDDIYAENSRINIVKIKSSNNYNFLFAATKNQETADSSTFKTNYSERIDRLLSAVFNRIPDNIELRKLHIDFTLDSNKVSLAFPGIEMDNNEFLTAVRVSEDTSQSICFLNGVIDKANKSLSLKLYSHSGRKIILPYVFSRYSLVCGFDTLSAGFYANGNADLMDLTGKLSVSGLIANHKKFSVGDVGFEKLAVNFNVHVYPEYIQLDSTSSIQNNKFILNPFLEISKSPKLKVLFRIHNVFSSNDLFESLPKGLFTNFEGIETEGELRLKILFELDMMQPDSLTFEAQLAGHNFNVKKWGVTNFSKIAGTFSYTVYESGNPVKTFDVGLENPQYSPMEKISPFLKEAVLISENGGFFWSDGFNVDAFRQSIVQNIKAGKFVRGGSTIDMQFVKNVFLTRNKTIARKVEEILIVWLINTLRLCSKEKMYENYLNIIEWGPGIYGVTEASEYYFNKKPIQLSLAESIFLASIVPRPKWYANSFDENARLLESNQAYFTLLAQKLIDKGIASPRDTFDMLKLVELKGQARKQIISKNMEIVPNMRRNEGFRQFNH